MSLRRVALSLGTTAAAAGLAGCSSQRLLWPQQRATCARAAMSDTAVHRPEWRRFAVEMGTGTSLRRQDHTAAAVRALEDALWRVSMTAYRALDKRPEEMKIEVVVGVPKPAAVDESAVLAVLPYGAARPVACRRGLSSRAAPLSPLQASAPSGSSRAASPSREGAGRMHRATSSWPTRPQSCTLTWATTWR